MPRSLSLHGALPQPVSRPALAIATKGFRPFFLLAAAFAVAIVPLWLAVLDGVASPIAYLDPVSWHAHEMIFGFTAAVVAGFLLTAVGNWTQRETLVGAPLLALAGVWLLGRVAMVSAGSLPRGLPALVDLAFLPLLIGALARAVIRSGNRRALLMPGVLVGLFATSLAVHMDALGVLPAGSARRACSVALDVILIIVLIISGRVFPMFTRNATGVQTIRSIRALDVATVAGMVAVTALDAMAADPKVVGSVAGVVGVLAALRAMHWGARHSFGEPLLWILHAGYAWVVVGLLLRAATGWGAALPIASATHALTVGALGSLTLGMMARVSLGHTGRPLVVRGAMCWAFAAISGAAAARVILPMALPDHYLTGLVVAGALWTSAFMTFLVVYAPILWRPRADGAG